MALKLVKSFAFVTRFSMENLSWCHVCFVSFRLNAFIEAGALCSIVLRYIHIYSIYAGSPTATSVSSFFSFFFFGDVAFSEYFFCTIAVFSLYGECAVRFFLPDGVFLPCDHVLDFFTSAYVRIR